jgi:hypothetical protein
MQSLSPVLAESGADVRRLSSLLKPDTLLAPSEDQSAFRKTKIVCTLGPKTSSVDKIVELMNAGMNVARMNFR